MDFDSLVLRWISPVKPSSLTYIDLSEVVRIIPGVDGDFWRGKVHQLQGIEIFACNRTLRLVCPDIESWKLWFTGLLYAQQRAVTNFIGDISLATTFIRRQWNLTDIDKDGFIDTSEMTALLSRFNCNENYRYAMQICEVHGNKLDYETFKMVRKHIR